MRNSQVELLAIKAASCRSPDTFLLAVIQNEQANPQLRVQAAGLLLPFKCARVTDPPIETSVPIIECKTAADAQFNVGVINHFEASGRIGHASAESLRKGQQAWLESHIINSIQIDAKAALRALEGKEVLTKLQVYSGLPSLPLGNADGPVIMPGEKDPPPDDSNPWGNGE
jgi:hypothetical protein